MRLLLNLLLVTISLLVGVMYGSSKAVNQCPREDSCSYQDGAWRPVIELEMHNG